jgi:hypothetical protein
MISALYYTNMPSSIFIVLAKLKQQSTEIHVIPYPLGHIILTQNQPVFVFTP